MLTMSDVFIYEKGKMELPDGFRLQDVTAKTARIKLFEAVRVLRAATFVLYAIGEKEAAETLTRLLVDAAKVGDVVRPLAYPPSMDAVAACTVVDQQMAALYGRDILKALGREDTDVFTMIAERS